MESSQQPDTQPGRYYVTAIDGPRRYFLAGPWPTHGEALAQVEAVRRYADASALGCDPTTWQLRSK